MKKNKLQVNKKDTSEQEINVISKASRRAWTTFGIIALVGNDNPFFVFPTFITAMITCVIIGKLASNTRKRTIYGNDC